jgi:polygalacturonase
MSLTLQQQVEALAKSGGGELVIPAGTYHEPLRLSGILNLRLRAEGEVIFDGSQAKDAPKTAYGLRLMECHNLEVEGITWTGWPRKALHATDSADLHFTGCKWLHSKIEDGAHFGNCDRLTVEDCEAAHCGRLHGGKGAHGIYLANGGSYAAIIGCNLHDLPGAGVQVNATEGQRLQSHTEIRDNRIENVISFGVQCAGLVDSAIAGNSVSGAGHSNAAVFLGAYGAGKQWACKRVDVSKQAGKIVLEAGSEALRC